jgi:Raf kinase inhibitor-like YbhB/YbcL family protein
MTARRTIFPFAWVISTMLLISFYSAAGQPGTSQSAKAMNLKSNSFKSGEFIPGQNTCDGLDFSPHLEWSDIPSGTQSFAIICNDPDAPAGDWIHWVVVNIPANVHHLDEHFVVAEHTFRGVIAGINDFRLYEYRGPCPPGGVHRYFFRVFALDVLLDVKKGISASDLQGKMKGHILAEGVLMGKYSRK